MKRGGVERAMKISKSVQLRKMADEIVSKYVFEMRRNKDTNRENRRGSVSALVTLDKHL